MNASAPKDIAALLKEERAYDVVPTQVLASMNGLDFMQAMVDGKIPAPPITRTMGFLITKVEKGFALAEAIPSFDYYNPIGSVHGGYAATLLDTVPSRGTSRSRNRFTLRSPLSETEIAIEQSQVESAESPRNSPSFWNARMNVSWTQSWARSRSPAIRYTSRKTRSTCASYSARSALGSPARTRSISSASLTGSGA